MCCVLVPEADTIEEKIIELQEKKQMVFDCTVGNSNQAMWLCVVSLSCGRVAFSCFKALQRLSAEDISFLFSLPGLFNCA